VSGDDIDLDGVAFDCCMCSQECSVSIGEDNDGLPEVQPGYCCTSCGKPVCDSCWKKCPEDDAGDKVCEECARG